MIRQRLFIATAVVLLVTAGFLALYLFLNTQTCLGDSCARNSIVLRIIRKIPQPLKEILMDTSIRLHYSHLDEADLNDVEKTDILREWVFRTFPRSWAKDTQSKYYLGETAPDSFLYSILENAGVSCAGVAYILMRVYRFYGLESYVYHIGDYREYQHSVTLVKVKDKNRSLWLLQDPSYNAAYYKKKNHPYDVRDLSRAVLSHKKKVPLIFHQGSVRQNPYACTESDPTCRNTSKKIIYVTPDLSLIKRNIVMFSHPRNLSEILNGLDAKVHSGLKNDILQVLKLPDFYLN